MCAFYLHWYKTTKVREGTDVLGGAINMTPMANLTASLEMASLLGFDVRRGTSGSAAAVPKATFVGVFTPTPISPPPPNDDISNAARLTPGAAATVSTTGATLAQGEPSQATVSNKVPAVEGQEGGTYNVPIGQDVWYSYTPSTSGTSTITTDGSNFDTVLAVYKLTDPSKPVTYNNLTRVIGNDDDGTGQNIPGGNSVNSTVTFNTQAGTQYYVQSGGYSNDSGNLTLSVTERAVTPTTIPTPPANNTPCYCTDTRILTWRVVEGASAEAEMAVEDLSIGDIVVTAAGTHRPIRWIGTRSYTGRFANTNPAVLPVCVKVGALADGIPNRDLWVSPDHALYLDGVLIPAEHLVNGATIVKADRVESVTYWHIELDSHDVLLAEGAPAESFVDDGGRAIFHNAASYRALYPHQPVWPVAAVYCAERVTHGYALEAVRRRLALRAGLPVAPARVFGTLLGHLDLCDGSRITGWAQDLAHPDGPVCLDIVVDGAVVALAYAKTYRADLAAAGIGDGCHAFDLVLPQPLAPGAAHTVEVRRSADSALVGALRVEAAIAIAA